MGRAAGVIVFALLAVLARYAVLQSAPPFLPRIYADLVFLLALPACFAAALGLKLGRLGLGKGKTAENLKHVAVALLASAPLIFVASRLPVFYAYYPLFGWARSGAPAFVAYEALILVFLAATEFFFRGFMLFGARELGPVASNALQAALYAAVHVGKPALEIPASAAGGMYFGWIDEKSGSILPSVILHFGFNVLMDLFCLQAAAQAGLPAAF